VKAYIVYIEGAQAAYDLHASLEDKKLSVSLDDSKVVRGLYIVKFWYNHVPLKDVDRMVKQLIKLSGHNVYSSVTYL
jgi:hypothetical protein